MKSLSGDTGRSKNQVSPLQESGQENSRLCNENHDCMPARHAAALHYARQGKRIFESCRRYGSSRC